MAYTKSILRYPGGKTRFAPFIQEALSLNKAAVSVFAEPFCGSASVSLCLLEANAVDRVLLNDSDPLIAALWKTVFSSEAHWLAEQMLSVPLTLDEWKRQRASAPRKQRERALKALYLNRTSFNGILYKAGPLGGWGQENRTLGVRFPREKLAKRILELAQLKDRIVATTSLDWREFVERHRGQGAFFYLDPPYFHKANKLYGHYFDLEGHVALRDYLSSLKDAWLLSYDDAREIRELYKPLKLTARVIDNTYSAHPMGGSSFIGRELFFSNMKKLPLPHQNGHEHIGMSVKQYRTGRRGGKAKKIPWAQVALAKAA